MPDDQLRAGPTPADMQGMTRRTFNGLMGAALSAGPLHHLGSSQGGTSEPPRPAGADDALCDLGAVELASRIRRKDVSARELLAAHLARIERVNPRVNAIVTLAAERAIRDAARADELTARGGTLGPLHGLPAAHKDLVATAGIRTTLGSRIFRDDVPDRDALIVARIRAAGAVTLGKTNTPELGAGSQTFNDVFGATLNPYDPTKTCGGSSGGAAVALRCGLVPVADGSDTGGSLRNPPAFCNVVGLRPSPGRVPREGGSWGPLSVSGPVGRSVADVALLLSAIAGPDASNPLSLPEDGASFRRPLGRDLRGVRIAWWKGLGGIPFEPAIRQVIDGCRPVFEQLGCVVTDDEPDFSGVDRAFRVLRFAYSYSQYRPLVRDHPDLVKDEVKFEVREAERMTGADVGLALARQAKMYDDTRRFFERHDFFVLPVTQVSPFAVTTRWPDRIDGTPMVDYIDWMRSCWYVTMMGSPAASVPAGFTASGLPVGLQIVGRHRDDWGVLQTAHAFEQATRHGERRPPVLG